MAETREQRLARIKAERDAARAAEEAAKNKPSVTQVVREHTEDLTGFQRDPLFGVTDAAKSGFDQGNETFEREKVYSGRASGGGPPPSIEWLPNELDKFDIFNYNVSIFQVHPKHINKLESLFTDRDAGKYMTLIADNKVEAMFNVNEVTINNAVGMSSARTGLATKFTINIIEPGGARFLEALAVSAKKLQIENHLQATYIIRVEFIGRDHNGKVFTHSPVFYYPVTFITVESGITERGSEYLIEAVETHSGAYNYLESSLKTTLVVEAETVGEYISELEKRVNKTLDEEFVTNVNQLYVDSYKISFIEGAGEWLNYKFETLTNADGEGLYNSQESSESSLKTKNKLQFNLPHGSSMLSIIGSALYATKEYKLLNTHDGGTVKAIPEGPSQTKLDKFPVFFKVIPQVTYGEYDYLRGDYQKTYTLNVKPYILPELIIDAVQYQSSITNKGIQDSRVDELARAKLLRKRYDYIFTGKNRDIMKLDLQFNMAYYLISVIGNGATGDPQKDAEVNATRKATDNKLKAAKRAYIDAKREFDTARRKEEQLNEAIKNRETTITAENPELRIPHNGIQYADVGSVINQGSSNLAFNQSQRQINEEIASAKIAQVAAESDMMMARMDIDATVTEIKKLNELEEKQDISAPVRFASDVIDDAETYGPESNRNGGSLQFGNVMANAENSADLLNIDLVIRGDPYWLGAPKLKKPQETIADYEKGTPLYFLNVKFPQVGNPNESLKVPSDEYSVSGIYKVIEVTHSFSSGLFTQTLKSVRDTATNTSTVKDKLTASEAKLIRPNIQETMSASNANQASGSDSGIAGTINTAVGIATGRPFR